MPTASRNERKKRRVKRTNTLLRKALQQSTTQHIKTHIALVTILAQKGGEITVTAGTIQQAQQNIARLGYKIIQSTTDPQEYVITLIEGANPSTEQSDALPVVPETPETTIAVDAQATDWVRDSQEDDGA